MKKGMLLLLIISLVVSCDIVDDSTNDKELVPEMEMSNIQSVKYGNSFGFCVGFCNREIEVRNTNIQFEANTNEVESKTINRKSNIDINYWEVLIKSIDINDFISLKSTIGCPDCADGGAEWLEVKGANVDYKVTFEYGNEPQVLKDALRLLRAYNDVFEIDDDKQLAFNENVLINVNGVIKGIIETRGFSKFLIGIPNNKDTVFYFDEQLPFNLRKDNLKVNFIGVLKKDSTDVFKPAANDVPIFDFRARNIRVF